MAFKTHAPFHAPPSGSDTLSLSGEKEGNLRDFGAGIRNIVGGRSEGYAAYVALFHRHC